MTAQDSPQPQYPYGLLEWAGHRTGGVRRLFDSASGRPGGELIETPLLHRLREWATAIAGGKQGAPRVVLLLGGPGNGKTEAIEEALRALESELAIDGAIQERLRADFNPADGSTVPRLVKVDTNTLPHCAASIVLTLVQDASVADPRFPGKSAAALLVDDLEAAEAAPARFIYLICINRGVLDDAMILATESGRTKARDLLEAIVQAVGMSPSAPPCWPLARYPSVAIWPMDVESLLVPGAGASQSPAAQVLSLATDAGRWPEPSSCAAGGRCPYCNSRELLSGVTRQSAFLTMLRWYELATGKRWSFRDLFSLVSFVLAGAAMQDASHETPCERAARLFEMTGRVGPGVNTMTLASPFLLVAAQYQHAMFSSWPRLSRNAIRARLRELRLEQQPTLLGLAHFLAGVGRPVMPSTLEGQLQGLSDALDPALADPDMELAVSSRTVIRLRDLDEKFSRSVLEGLTYIRKYQCLSASEVELLTRLADAESDVSAPEARRRKPTAAASLQQLLRDFACRLVRRSLGALTATVRERDTLQAFENVVAGNPELMHLAVKQVEGLMNDRDRFMVTLNTTFGEPLPPAPRRVTLMTGKQKVRRWDPPRLSRPVADALFLTIGSNTSTQPIPLTYELFRSARELQGGLLTSSLPRTVFALLDTTRARLAGRIVRDEEQLDGAEIRVGDRGEVIVRELGRFLVRKQGEE